MESKLLQVSGTIDLNFCEVNYCISKRYIIVIEAKDLPGSCN